MLVSGLAYAAWCACGNALCLSDSICVSQVAFFLNVFSGTSGAHMEPHESKMAAEKAQRGLVRHSMS